MKCRKCGRTAHEIGGYLKRVNEKGVPGVWECRPSCDASMPPDDKLMAAIDGEASGSSASACSRNSCPRCGESLWKGEESARCPRCDWRIDYIGGRVDIVNPTIAELMLAADFFSANDEAHGAPTEKL